MAAETKIGLPEVGLSIIPGYGGTQRLPRIVGRGRALEMILTGRPIDAETGHRFGLINRVAPAAELRAETEKLAGAIMGNGPLALAMATESVLRGTEVSLEEGLRIECDLFGIISSTSDMPGSSAVASRSRGLVVPGAGPPPQPNGGTMMLRRVNPGDVAPIRTAVAVRAAWGRCS